MIAKQEVGIRQSKAELFCFRVDGTGTASILEGQYHATLTDNGTGDYTLTFARPFARVPVVVGAVAVGADLAPKIVTVTASALNIKWMDLLGDGTPAEVDCDFHVTVLGFFSDTER